MKPVVTLFMAGLAVGLGVGPVCWLTAAMNVGAAAVLWRGGKGGV